MIAKQHSRSLRIFFTHSGPLIFFIFIFLNSSPVYSDQHLPPDLIDFDHITLEDGLINPVVYDIVKDRHGFLWFATGNGVSRFDGYQFYNYLPDENDSGTIGRGPVIQLYIDSKDRLWAVVIGSGLYRYNEHTDEFEPLTTVIPGTSRLSSTNIYSMAEGGDGTLWVSTMDAGLNRIDEQTGVITHLRHDPDTVGGLPSDQIYAIFIDSSNDLWLSTIGSGLSRYDIDTGTFSTLLPKMPQSIGMYEDRHGDIWIPTLGRGVARYIRQEDSFTFYSHEQAEPNSLSHNQVVKVTEDSSGTVWLTTWGGGINVFDRENNSFTRHQHSLGRSASLSDNNTWALFAEKTGIIWIGTYGAGINKYDRKTERFPLIRHNPANANSLRSDSVKALHQDSDGDIWYGTLGGGLSRFSRQTRTFTHYFHDPGNPDSISNDNIWGIAEDQAANLWIATEHGLNMFERSTGRFIRFLHDPENPHSPGSNLIRSVMVDQDNTVWLGTQLVGIDRYDRKQNRFYHYQVDGPHNTSLFQDSRGRIWTGNVKTISTYDTTTDTFEELQIHHTGSGNILKGIFTSIKEDSSGMIWIGTTHGLYMLSPKGQMLMSYGARDGLHDEAIADFQFDAGGNVWVSTARGISMLDLEQQHFRNYVLGSFNRRASISTTDGKLYFGGLRGVSHFSPEQVEDNPNIPPVVVTRFTIANGERTFDSHLSELQHIELTHRDRLFSFEFAALDYADPDKNSYRYRLKGFDDNWIEAGSGRRFATYTNLNSGKYTFELMGSNNDGIWNPEPVSIELTLLPPWWKSWWFYLISVMVVGGTLSLIYRSKVRQLHNERQTSRQLRESEEKFRLIFENSPLGIVHFNHQGSVTACNDLLCSILAGTTDNLVGCQLPHLLLSTELTEAITATLQGRISHCEEAYLNTQHGEQTPVRAMFGPVYSSEGEVAGGIGIIEDVTAKMKAEAEASRLEEKLQQAMKMEAIGTLAGGIAHDFNNILSVILGYADIAKEDVKKESPEPAIDDLEKITLAANRAKELVKQILAFSRQSDTERSLLQPAPLVREAIKMLRPTLPATIAIHTDLEDSDCYILANHSQINQIVMNLCTNAFHAMEQTGGDLTISFRKIQLSREDSLSEKNAAPGNYIQLVVSDTGSGIPKEIQHRIFEPYFTTKSTGKGTGMGLAIVHGIIQSYGGFLSLYSQPGQGTSIRISIPVAEGTLESHAGLQEHIPRGNERILLVDDEEMLVNMGRIMLENLGYSVTGIASSVSALEIFLNSPGEFDAVITDQTMPGMTGDELAVRILEVRPDIPIVLCTGYSSLITEEKAKKIGVKAFALKPLVRKDIARLIRQVLDQ